MPLLTLVVMLALHVESPAPQERADSRSWYQAYDEGLLAVGKNDAAAIASLDAAKRKGPKPGRNVNTYGDAFITFKPDYYLGVAYLNQRRFADAVAAFQRVRDAQLIGPKDKENAAFTAQNSKALFELAIETGEQALATGQFDQALQAVTRALGTVGITNAADIRRATDLADKVEKAKTTTSKAGTTPPPVDPKVPATAPTDPKLGAPTGQPVDPDTTKPAYGNASPTVDPKGPKAPSKSAGSKSTANPSAVVAARERAAMALFFRGDYGGALSLLRTLSVGPAPTARAYFYLACAQAGLVLSGQADPQTKTLQEAQALFASARGDSDAFSEDRRHISPRVLQVLGAKQ